MTQIMNSDKQGLNFEITSARISEETQKRHVIYTLQIRYVSGVDDLTPSVIERRYTQFQSLFDSLKRDFPSEMTDVAFPKKVLTGNFDNELISARSTAFEKVLRRIALESKLRTSKAMQKFLQEPELNEAKILFDEKRYDVAFEKFLSMFRLLNKIFSDRSPAVLMVLCRLIACCFESPILSNSVKWADLGLYRFDGVSDSDLLELYLPLLHASIKIYEANNKDAESLKSQLNTFQKQGMKDPGKSLLEVLNEVEAKLL
ncbi:hypothetical protein ABEB36_006373 [Hypothenemus hampei]|uniref:PX domain-containing protein n=1 Tax=Hypothenemus hampei TaxID=57062 RepID=A0ABD1EQT7_HYPHA